MAGPEAGNDVCVILYSQIVAKLAKVITVLVIQGRSLAKGGQLAPRVVAEDTCCDDRGKVEAAAQTTAACSQASDMVAARAAKHEAGVEGQEEHRDAAQRVNETKAIARLKAIFIDSTVILYLVNVLLRFFQVIGAVLVWEVKFW